MPEPDAPPSGGFPVVGVGASAGGLEAFMQLLQALPEHTGMAFVLVQHLDPRHDSKLAELLAKSTSMPVLEVANGCVVEPDHVYVIAPDTALELAADGTLQTEARGERPGPHLPIDHFFRSLAAWRTSRAIGVVLSGTGTDGTVGLEEIKAAGGITFAQDEASAKFAGMPVAALQSGCVDLALPPDRIAAELARVGRHPYLAPPPVERQHGRPAVQDDEDHFRSVLALLRAASGVDFSAYRDTTIKRRIMRRLLLHGGSLAGYSERLKDDPAELDALYQDILINVTKFFREPEVFETLKQRVFPEILAAKQGNAPIRIWVPGCSTGQEAYSLAIAMLEFLNDKPVHPPIQIFATDLSEAVSLQKARAGLYPGSIEAELSAERLRRFFEKEDSHYRISKTLRDMVIFARQNVAADPPFSRVDLVSCRNLLIYLSPALQKRVIPTFHYALNPGGHLVLGASETIGGHGDLFTVVDQPHRIYVRKPMGGARPYPHFRSDGDQARMAGGEAIAPTRAMPADWQREADRVAAGQYGPPGVLINDDFDVLQFRGETGSFLAPAAGEPSHNLLKMAREGLFMAVRSAVVECQGSGGAVRHPGVRIRGEGADREVDLHVLPVRLPHAGERCYLVLFEETSRRVTPSAPHSLDALQSPEAGEVRHLRQELASTREYLQSLIEQQDAANEELRSANEEILSSNEELQSANEEMETAKEELQSTNEELTTVNEQLQYRNVELAHLNDDMTNLLGSSGVPMVVLGIDLRIRRFTPAAGRLLGLLAGDVGRPIGHLKTCVALAEMESRIGEVIASVQPQERDIRGPDGRSYQLRIHPYRTLDNRIDGAVLVLLDVDELRRAQAGLRDERDYAQAIVETVREPLLVLDSQLRVQYANAAFYGTFRVAPDETQGRLLYDLGNRQWDIPVLRRQLTEVLSQSNDVIDFEVWHEFESIGLKVMRLNARRVAHEGSSSELILLAIEDQTEVVRLQEQSRQHLAHVVEDDQRKTAFLALLAHELRNPLAPIRNAMHVLNRDGVPEDIARHMRAMIDRQVQQLTRLVDDLLDIARINKGTVELHKERLDLSALLRLAADAERSACEAKNIDLSAALPESPVPIDGDAMRLTQAMGNLINNACKFTDAGGRIALALERDGREAVVRVTDSGIGIAPELLPHVFDMFVQGDGSRERSQGGLGLGLTLVKQLIEAHGGTVTAASEGIGHGSEFVLHLPMPDAPQQPVSDSFSAERAAVSSAPRRILVVDDNRDSAESLTIALRLQGHEVRTAHDGQAAIQLAESWRPEIVLLDIGLPGMNGYDVARRMGDHPWRRDMRLIALTGWGQATDRDRSAAAGFDAHLVKPVELATLIELL
ncbi:MAG TPA: chemotaxis protein CheB [Albitalea sp.]|uniref:chemotaxis protein CheB n=1 Tax=Piscinibacter sp. TaxID=1903157 RepID=UPI002ED68E37